jgi:hypothetical protein
MLLVLMLKGTRIMTAAAIKQNRLKRPDLTSAGASLQEAVSKELTWVRRVAAGELFSLREGHAKKGASLSAKHSSAAASKKHTSISGKHNTVSVAKKKSKKK